LSTVDFLPRALTGSALCYGRSFFPLDLGGRDSISNVVLACTACNRKKGEAPPNLQDILRWNELAKVWPHIHPLSLDRHVRIKKAVRCL
jgi:HNH endonuclease